jgi:hypothetical protein
MVRPLRLRSIVLDTGRRSKWESCITCLFDIDRNNVTRELTRLVLIGARWCIASTGLMLLEWGWACLMLLARITPAMRLGRRRRSRGPGDRK